uniref:Uncharacterized protein n=1 Tax=Proboscia inermis TaxID=420281 RepID=A0A7S0CJV2_9STRA
MSKLELETKNVSQCIILLMSSLEQLHSILKGNGGDSAGNGKNGEKNCIDALSDIFNSLGNVPTNGSGGSRHDVISDASATQFLTNNDQNEDEVDNFVGDSHVHHRQ